MATNKTDFDSFLDDLRKITNETLSLNEADEEKPEDDKNKKEDETTSGDLDDLLKGSESDSSKDGENKDDGIGDLPDLNDLGSEDNKDRGEEKTPDLPADSDSGDTKDSFETDNEGLADTITKLAKSGHKVTITVTAEGKEYFLGKKKVTPKQIFALAEIVLPKTPESSNNKMLKSLMEQISSLKNEIKGLKSGSVKPIQETKFMKISEENYNALTEMVENLKFTVDEQKMIIENYKAMESLGESDADIAKMMEGISEDIDTFNSMMNKNDATKAYAKALDKTLTIMSEDIMPILSSLSETKASILAELDTTPVNFNINSELSHALKDVDSAISEMNQFNMVTKVNALVESKLPADKPMSKKDVMNILTEATSEIVVYDSNPDYPTNFPTYEPFAKRVQNTLSAAMGNGDTSKIAANLPDDGENLISRHSLRKFDLPIARPNGFNENVTVRSAIMNLQEALVDIDGKINFDLCEQAYLYKKVTNPTSLKDFAFPIAISENGNLVAVPKLIETAAKILENDSCIRTYGIDSRETFYTLREDLEHYLNKIGVDAPWKDTITLEEVKSRGKRKKDKDSEDDEPAKKGKKSKKGKCSECGAECDDEDCELCPECEEAKKKAEKKSAKSAKGKK